MAGIAFQGQGMPNVQNALTMIKQQRAQAAQPQITPPEPAPAPAPAVQPPPGPVPQPAKPPTPAITPPAAAANPMDDMKSYLGNQLQNPSRYDAGAVKDSYNFLKGDLESERDKGLSAVDVDAAKRGVFHSTIPVGGGANVQAQFQRGLGQLASSQALDQARTYGNDQNNAVQNAFHYGDQQQQNNQFGANLGLQSAQLGFQGGYSPQETSQQMTGMPIGGQQSSLSGLGALYGSTGGVPAPVGVTAPAKQTPPSQFGLPPVTKLPMPS